MRKTLGIVFLLVLLEATAFGTERKTYPGPTQTALPFLGVSSRGSSASTQVVKESPSGNSYFRVGGELGILQGLQSDFGYGGTMGYAFRLSEKTPLYVGMDVGWAQYSTRFDTPTKDANGKDISMSNVGDLTFVQVQATISYRFLDEKGKRAHPYIGGSIGPALAYASNENIKLGDQAIAPDKTMAVKYEVLFRPGVDIDLTDLLSLQVEPKFGIFQGRFLFAPQMGLRFSL